MADYVDGSSSTIEDSEYPYNSPDMFFIERDQALERIAEKGEGSQSELSTDVSSDQPNEVDDGEVLPASESVGVSSEADLSGVDPKIDDSSLQIDVVDENDVASIAPSHSVVKFSRIHKSLTS